MPIHGKRSTYVNHRCRCDECRTANTTYQLRSNQKRSQRPHVEVPHGRGGYTNWGCRCEVCTEANRKACAEYQARRREKTAAVADAPATTAAETTPNT